MSSERKTAVSMNIWRGTGRVASLGLLLLLAVACGPDKRAERTLPERREEVWLAQYLDGVWRGEITDDHGMKHRIVLRFNRRNNEPRDQIGDLDFKTDGGYRSFMIQLPDKGPECARVVRINQWSMAPDGSSKAIGFDGPFEHCFASGGSNGFEMRETGSSSAELITIGGADKRIGAVTRE